MDLRNVRLQPVRMLPRPSAHAMVLFETIYYKRGVPLTLDLIAHELVHVEQFRKHGWRMIPLYVWRWIRAGFSYQNHPMEIEARVKMRWPRYRTAAFDLLFGEESSELL